MAHRGLSLEKRNQIKKYITEGPLWSFPTLRELSRALCLITNHNDANQIYMHIYYLDRYYNILNENGLIRRKRGKTLGKFCQNFGAPYKPLFLRSKKMRSSKKEILEQKLNDSCYIKWKYDNTYGYVFIDIIRNSF